MTEAFLETVPPDPAIARVFLERAEQVWSDAGASGLEPVSQQLWNWQACISAMDAVLLVGGKRVAGSEGGHRLRIDATEEVLPTDQGALFERLHSHRELRNEASYAIGVVSKREAESLHQRRRS